MNKYQEEFEKFAGIAVKDHPSFEDAVDEVKSSLTYKTDYSGEEAIVVLGYSGNGKTTWINNFRRNNPGYEVISFDEIVKKLTLRYGDNLNGDLLNAAVGEEIEKLCREHANIIFDGRYINLFTRCALTQTLHSYGYFVSMVDLTDLIDVTLIQRIYDYCSADVGTMIDGQNINKFRQDPRVMRRYDDIMEFHDLEKRNSLFDLQKKLGIVYIDADFIMDFDGKTDNSFDSMGAKK